MFVCDKCDKAISCIYNCCDFFKHYNLFWCEVQFKMAKIGRIFFQASIAVFSPVPSCCIHSLWPDLSCIQISSLQSAKY